MHEQVKAYNFFLLFCTVKAILDFRLLKLMKLNKIVLQQYAAKVVGRMYQFGTA